MMRLSILALALLALLNAALGADPDESLPGVIDLTPANFDTVVDGKRGALVEFYAGWCGHCKSLTPEMKKLGEAVQTDPLLKNRVIVAKVNADTHSELGSKYGIQGVGWKGKEGRNHIGVGWLHPCARGFSGSDFVKPGIQDAF
ncbi:thioredoxin-like protein [Dunaliella salina]|uniref:Thioredoxin-like protein n=1 Tax=Dunaliella salina TaxID=3046 RepID=A0ABQ7GC94_DUNSA|nr:thioredoxin-like protein [Dunaliella salina]|eukprot:KAF5832216.1 thioredoxin-like protein [Dunaliella salina]